MLLHAEVVHKLAPTHVTLVLGINTTLVPYVTLHVFQPFVAAATLIRAHDSLSGFHSGGGFPQHVFFVSVVSVRMIQHQETYVWM